MTTATQESIGLTRIYPPEPTIEISEFKLRELWCKGIVNDLTYIAFALQFGGNKNLDVSRFVSEWSVTELSEFQIEEGWKNKMLKAKSVLGAICVLNDKGFSDIDFDVKVNQLSLFD